MTEKSKTVYRVRFDPTDSVMLQTEKLEVVREGDDYWDVRLNSDWTGKIEKSSDRCFGTLQEALDRIVEIAQERYDELSLVFHQAASILACAENNQKQGFEIITDDKTKTGEEGTKESPQTRTEEGSKKGGKAGAKKAGAKA